MDDELGMWVARCADLRYALEWYREALLTITSPADSGPFITAYREVGGGYDGLQAIARLALDEGKGA